MIFRVWQLGSVGECEIPKTQRREIGSFWGPKMCVFWCFFYVFFMFFWFLKMLKNILCVFLYFLSHLGSGFGVSGVNRGLDLPKPPKMVQNDHFVCFLFIYFLTLCIFNHWQTERCAHLCVFWGRADGGLGTVSEWISCLARMAIPRTRRGVQECVYFGTPFWSPFWRPRGRIMRFSGFRVLFCHFLFCHFSKFVCFGVKIDDFDTSWYRVIQMPWPGGWWNTKKHTSKVLTLWSKIRNLE